MKKIIILAILKYGLLIHKVWQKFKPSNVEVNNNNTYLYSAFLWNNSKSCIDVV